MRLQRFPAGVKPLQTDLNAIGENVEGGFADLISVFSANEFGGVLFDSIEPLTSVVGNDVTIVTPAQTVSVGGAVETSQDYTEVFDVDDGGGGQLDLKVEIFFVITRDSVTATRNFLSLDPTTNATILQNLEAEMSTVTRVRVVYLWSNNLTSPDQTPVLGTDDVGFVKLATVLYDTGTTTVNLEETSRFALPAGTSVTISGHASTHLPGGTDPIPVSALDTSLLSGSSAGLMPEGALYVNRNCFIDIIPNNDSAFLTFATAGSNTVVGDEFEPRLLQVGLRTDGSLTVTTPNSAPSLGVKFGAKNIANGFLDEAARRDHIHALSESGIVLINLSEEVGADDAGTIITREITATDLPLNVTLSQILNIKYYWEPRNLAQGGEFADNRVELNWNVTPIAGEGLQTLGVRTLVLSPSAFSMEIGSAGLAFLTPGVIQEVQSWTSPQYVDGSYPKFGTIHIVVTALREGANG